MKYQATKKVPGGKLVRIKIDADHEINSVQICGDFFLHPEDALPHIEKQICTLPSSTTQQQLAQTIQKAITEKNANFIGASAEDLAQIITEALAQQKPT